MKRLLTALLAILALAAVPSPAEAAKRCGEGSDEFGQVFAIRSQHASCRVARQVAFGWYNLQSHGEDASRVFDSNGREWSCRITKQATGTDPGYNPYTHVRCGRRTKRVRFKLRS